MHLVRVLFPASVLPAVLAFSCAPGPKPAVARRPIPPPTHAVSPPPPVAQASPPFISATAVNELPAEFALDGDLSEWGSVSPATPSPPPDEPAGPASHVAVALTSDGAAIAAELLGGAKSGVWLGIAFQAAELPPVGIALADGTVQPLNCDSPRSGENAGSPQDSTCKTAVSRYAEFVAAQQARFARLYHLGTDGTHAVTSQGLGAPVDGARFAFKTIDDGITIEATLPAIALPRASQAPVPSMRLLAAVGAASAAPATTPDAWAAFDLAKPAGFEPWADLRAQAFAAAMERSSKPLGLSYQPGDPLGVEAVGYVGGSPEVTAVETRRELLYTRQTTFGDLEVGYSLSTGSSLPGGTLLAILKGGKPVDVIPLQGTPCGIVARGKELHVVSFARGKWGDFTGQFDYARFSAIAVGPDGTHQDDLVIAPEGNPDWVQVEEFHSPSCDSFGVRGNVRKSVTNEGYYVLGGLERTWRFDARARRYKMREREVPVLPERRP